MKCSFVFAYAVDGPTPYGVRYRHTAACTCCGRHFTEVVSQALVSALSTMIAFAIQSPNSPFTFPIAGNINPSMPNPGQVTPPRLCPAGCRTLLHKFDRPEPREHGAFDLAFLRLCAVHVDGRWYCTVVRASPPLPLRVERLTTTRGDGDVGGGALSAACELPAT